MSIQTELRAVLPYDQKSEVSYLRAIKSLLPQGYIWGFKTTNLQNNVIQDTIADDNILQDSIAGSVLNTIQDTISNISGSILASTKFGTLLSVFATELHRFQGRWYDLYTESLPGLSNELLPDWERVAGLPNKCTVNVSALSIYERQANVHAKLFSRPSKGLTKAFYINYAAILGYEISITEYAASSHPFLVAPIGIDPYNIGSRVEDRLNNSSDVANVTFEILSGENDPQRIARLQCEIGLIKPAHVKISWINSI